MALSASFAAAVAAAGWYVRMQRPGPASQGRAVCLVLLHPASAWNAPTGCQPKAGEGGRGEERGIAMFLLEGPFGRATIATGA